MDMAKSVGSLQSSQDSASLTNYKKNNWSYNFSYSNNQDHKPVDVDKKQPICVSG